MTGKILSARGKPFKREGDAQNAIKDKPGYHVVEDGKGGFVGVKETSETTDHMASHFDGMIAQKKEEREAKLAPGLDVVCPGCGQSYHSTTEAYDPEVFANPAMIDLKEPWKGYGWDDLGKDPSMGYGCLVCPDCGTALAPSGKLRVK